MYRQSSLKCPVDVFEKVWIERRMSWLARAFGVEFLSDAVVIEPTAEFFPDPYKGTENDARGIFDRVCEYMEIAPGSVDLGFLPTDDPYSIALGVYHDEGDKPQVQLRLDRLQDPMALVSTIAHELAHYLLLGQGKISRVAIDQEKVTDLLPVFLGLGIFCANSAIWDQTINDGLRSTWSIWTRGYLREREYGYALAVFAWLRDQHDPAWLRHVRSNVRSVFRESIRYFQETNDIQFTDKDVINQTAEERLGLFREAVHTGSPGERLSRMWDLRGLGPRSRESLSDVVCVLGDSSAEVRAEALLLLREMGRSARAAIPTLRALLQEDERTVVCRAVLDALSRIDYESADALPEVVSLLKASLPGIRLQAARTVAAYGPKAAIAVPALEELLTDANPETAEAAAEAIGAVGAPAKVAVPQLLACLQDRDAFNRSSAAFALGQIAIGDPNVTAALGSALTEYDPHVREEAAWALGQMKSAGKSEIAHLRRALRAVEVPIRLQAAVALAKLEGNVNDALAIFRESLPEPIGLGKKPGPNDEAITYVTHGLLELQDKLVGPLIRQLQEGSLPEKRFAAWCLARPGFRAPSESQNIRNTIDGADPLLHLLGVCGNCRLSQDFKSIVPELLGLLRTECAGCLGAEDAFRQCAMACLLAIGRDAVPDLIDSLSQSDDQWFSDAAEILGRIAVMHPDVQLSLSNIGSPYNESAQRLAQEALRLSNVRQKEEREEAFRAWSCPPVPKEIHVQPDRAIMDAVDFLVLELAACAHQGGPCD
jgi:HEAT repeat protein